MSAPETVVGDGPEWLRLLAAAVARRGSKQAVAAELGVSRTLVSLVLAGKYHSPTAMLEGRVLAAYARVDCPWLEAEISRAECAGYRERDCPTNSAEAVRHWRACKTCPVGRRLAGGSPSGDDDATDA